MVVHLGCLLEISLFSCTPMKQLLIAAIGIFGLALPVQAQDVLVNANWNRQQVVCIGAEYPFPEASTRLGERGIYVVSSTHLSPFLMYLPFGTFPVIGYCRVGQFDGFLFVHNEQIYIGFVD